jgi:hypothetical protein
MSMTERQPAVSAHISSLFVTLNALRAVIDGYLLLPVALLQPVMSVGYYDLRRSERQPTGIGCFRKAPCKLQSV